jgi:uncharacterized protein
MQKKFPSEYLHGIELFNESKYYEAHEVWEEIWLRSVGDERLFYQGLIQAAAALLHHDKGNIRGVQIVLPKALSKLESLPRVFMSLDLGRFTSELRGFLGYALQDGKALESSRPTIKLDYVGSEIWMQ